MSAPEISPFPLVELQAVSNAHNEWVALTFEVAQTPAMPSGRPDAVENAGRVCRAGAA
jgi:hypothetical protein